MLLLTFIIVNYLIKIGDISFIGIILVILLAILGALLMLWVAISTLIIIVLVKGKVKIKRELEQARGVTTSKSSSRMEPQTEINTSDNVAYGTYIVITDQ